MTPRREQGEQAVTLLELLVSVVTVAILLAVSFSAGKGVFAAGQAARCRSNMRQIGMALSSYALENRDCYPPAVLDSVNWKYWDMDAIWQYAMGTSPTAQMNYYTNYKTFIFCCPSSDKSRSASYGINVMFPAGVKNYYEPRKRAAVANPAFCLLLGEGVNHAIDSWWASSPPGQPVSFPHGGAMNLLFMDLHMETRKPSEIPKGGWSSPESTDPFWTGH